MGAASLESARVMTSKLENPHINGVHYQHIKTGNVYQVITTGFIEANLTPCVVYRSISSNTVWVRPLEEFNDGRFRQVVVQRASYK